MCAGPTQLPVEHDAATGRPVLLHVSPEIEHPLAYQHKTLDHPIERAAVQYLIAPTGCLQSAVAEFGCLPCTLQALEPLRLPYDKLLDCVTAHAKLDEVHRH